MTSIVFIQHITLKFLGVFTSGFKCSDVNLSEQENTIRPLRSISTPDSFDMRSTGAGRKQSAVAPSP